MWAPPLLSLKQGHFEGRNFLTTYHEFDCDVTWRHIILHQWWFLPAFRIPRHNAMGYDLVTLKKFDFPELFDIVQMANLKEETLTVRYNDSPICGQRSFLGWNPVLNHHWCVVRWRTSCLSRKVTAPPQTTATRLEDCIHSACMYISVTGYCRIVGIIVHFPI